MFFPTKKNNEGINPWDLLEPISISIILANCIVIAASLEYPQWRGWWIFEIVFLVLMAVETGARLYNSTRPDNDEANPRMQLRAYALSFMNVFDVIVIVLGVIGVVNLLFYTSTTLIGKVFSMLRLIRLIRLCRLSRNVLMLGEGVVVCASVLLWTVGALMAVCFSWAVVIRALLLEEETGSRSRQNKSTNTSKL